MRAEDNRRFVYFLVGLNILPHWWDLPEWVIGFGLTFILWKYASEHFKIPVPGKYSVHILGLLCGAGVYAEYGTVFGDDASSSILVLTVALKLFEVKKYRDIMVVTILCYFLLMSKLIASQSLSMTAFLIVDLILISSLLALHHSPIDQGKVSALTGRSIRLALVSFPIVVLLFFIFPRFSTGIFNPNQKVTAMTGFSDKISPGSVSKLINSDELVFRAKILGNKKLPKAYLYWRGAALEEANGLSWNRGRKGRRRRPRTRDIAKGSIQQEIYLEPTSSRFLFGLDWMNYVEFPSDVKRNRVGELRAKAFESRVPVKQKEYYIVYSTPSPQLTNWEQVGNIERNLEINIEDSPRTKKWLDELKSRVSSAELAVKALEEFYLAGKFVYTLQPSRMQTLDDFLFDAKGGFCEHYAAASASALRYLGFPARVVVGFHGGQTSLLGDYYQVRSQDAHAWLEYWSSEIKSWERFDPTAVVSPVRIQSGSDQLLSDLEDSVRRSTWQFASEALMKRFYSLQMLFDQVDANWTMFLLKYDYSYQKDLLRKIGFSRVTRWMLLGFSLLALFLFIGVVYLYFNRVRAPQKVYERAYSLLEVQLKKKGLVRETHEGYVDFAERVMVSRVEPKEKLRDFFSTYIELKYGQVSTESKDRELEFLASARELKLSSVVDQAEVGKNAS